MTTHCPVPLLPSNSLLAPSRSATRLSPPSAPPAPFGSWRYASLRRPRWVMPFSVFVSAASLSLAFFGPGWPHRAPRPVVEEEKLLALSVPLPLLRELEEPEPAAPDPDQPKPELAEYAPSLMDTPRLTLPDDFVQQIDLSTLLPTPDLSAAKVFVIPPHIKHGDGTGNGLGEILNLKDLDRIPEPTLQAPPRFPAGLRGEVETALVIIQFIVDTTGQVLEPVIISTSHPAFSQPALDGVRKWKFRPGMKAGRKVNTRMQVPITFHLVHERE